MNVHPGTACLGNPLFLIKARMQAYSPALPVGAQHYYRNSFAALREIFRAEGLRGYVRGMDAAILRTCMGSSVSFSQSVLVGSKNTVKVQLPSYNWTKKTLVKQGMHADSTWTFLASSTVSGACVVRLASYYQWTLLTLFLSVWLCNQLIQSVLTHLQYGNRN